MNKKVIYLLALYGFLEELQGKISSKSRTATAMLSKISATLNTGKLPNAIKSLTPPSKILSNRFPSVPASRRIKLVALSTFSLRK